MAVKGSGALSIATDIVGEFGGVAPHSLSEYYGGGTYVPAGANPGIATSGAINFGSHYSAVAATVLNITSNVNNYDIGAALATVGGSKTDGVPVIVDISSGVTVGSTSIATPAMLTGTGWSAGASITIINNGTIAGAAGTSASAGAGGAGGASLVRLFTNNNSNPGNPGGNSQGGDGGDAFEHSQTADNNLSVIFDTVGTRIAGAGGTGGGGGGGGGGGAGTFCSGYLNCHPTGHGGGGAGVPGGTSPAGASHAGSSTTGGTGSTGGGTNHNGSTITGVGGTGGNLGSAGGAGTGGVYQNRPGGAAGTGGNGAAGNVLTGNTSQIS
jgi:hypothetical protein